MVNGLAQAAEPTASQTQEFTTPSGTHRLKTACRQFEAMFLSRLLGESFKPVSALRGSVPGGALYGSLAVDAFASTLAKGGGLGIAEMLYRQLQGYLAGQAGAPPVESERPDGAAPGVEDTALQRMRAIDPVYRRLEPRGLRMLAVNVGQDRDTVRKFVERTGITYDVVLDKDEAVTRRYGVIALPVTYFIDSEGVVRHRILGESDAATFERMAETLLGTDGGTAPFR